MKLLHTGDLHLGRTLGDFRLIEDQRYILKQIVDLAEQETVDAVLVAGDVYDRAVPSEEAVALLDDFLCELAARKIKVLLISGNHDSDERLHFGSTLFQNSGIHIAAKYEGVLYRQVLEDAFGKLNVYLLPFVKASQVRHFFPEEKIGTYEDAVRVILDKAQPDSRERNVLVAHQFVAGGTDPKLAGSEGAAAQTVGLVEKISPECFDAFDYVALGHIHSPQRVGREEVRYSGSPLKYSLDEAGSEKSVPLVTIGEKGEVDIRLLPLKPFRDLRHIRGKRDQLLDPAHIESPEDYIYVTLTDEDIMDDAMGIFQQYYPNTVRIDYDNSHTRAIEQVTVVQVAREKSFSELISDFYTQVYGCEISGEEMQIMREAAGEAGVENAAD